MRFRKSVAHLAALVSSLLLVAACIDIPTFMQQPDVTLRVAVPDPTQAAYIDERIRDFERDNPTIRVEVMSRLSGFRGNLGQGITTLATTGNGLDVVYLTDQDFQSLSDVDILTDLTSYVRETTDLRPPEFYPTALPAFQNRGRQMALPAEMVPLVIFYNKDLFDQSGVGYPTADWTTQEFLVTAKKLTKEPETRNGVAGFAADPNSTVWSFVLAHGGEFPDPLRDASARTLTAPASIRGFQWFADLAVRERVTPQPLNNRSLGHWFGGRAAMAALFMNARNLVPSSGQPQAQATPTPGPRQTWPFRWDVAPIPREERRATVVYVAGYAIPKGAKHPDEAWQLIRHLTRTLPVQATAGAYVPAIKSLSQSPEFAALYPESGRKVYLDSVEFGYTIPLLPAAARPNDQDLSPIFRGEISAEQGLQRLREKMAPSLQKWVQERQ